MATRKMTTLSSASGKIQTLSALFKPRLHPHDKVDHSDIDKTDSTLSDLETLIEDRCLSGNLDIHEALGYFHSLTLIRPLPHIWNFNHLFSSIYRMNHHSIVMSMYNTLMGYACFRPEITTLNCLIRCYCAVERVDLGFSVLAHALKLGLVPNHHTLNILLHQICSQGSMVEAMKLFHLMMEEKYRGKRYSYAIVINGLCKAGETWRAFELLKEVYHGQIVMPDSGCFSPVINNFFKEGLVEEALGLFDVMTNLNISPDAATCNTLLRGLCKRGRWEEADKLLIDMQSKHGLLPTTYTYNILLDCLCKGDKIDEAMSIFKLMTSKGVEPDLITFNSLLSGLTLSGRWSEVPKMFRTMNCFGISPKSSTFGTIISALCKEGRIDEALNVIEEMTNRGLKPSVVVYNSIINGLCFSGKLWEAIKMLDRMNEQAVQPCVVTFNILVEHLGRRRRVHDALKLLKDMVLKGLVPDAGTREILMHILAARLKHKSRSSQ